MVNTPQNVARKCSNWIGWKTPKGHQWNLSYQDMADLALICHECLSEKIDYPLFADVGTCVGNATSVLASYAKEFGGTVISMDIFADRPGWPSKETKACFNSNMKELDLDDVISLHHDSSLAVADMYANESFDLVYVDASHIYSDIKADIEAWWPKVKKGGFIVGHDCELNPTPEQLIEIKKDPNWATDDCTKVGHAGVIVATKEFFGDRLQQRNHTWWVKK